MDAHCEFIVYVIVYVSFNAITDSLRIICILFGCRCVEVGCGSGYVVCSIARALQGKCHCIAIDINKHACQATLKTAQAHAVDNQMDVLQSDLVNVLLPQMAGKVDLLVFNPPYVVTPDEEVERKDIATAWAGGKNGRRVIDRLLPMIPTLLSNGGVAFMVVIPENKPQGNPVIAYVISRFEIWSLFVIIWYNFQS